MQSYSSIRGKLSIRSLSDSKTFDSNGSMFSTALYCSILKKLNIRYMEDVKDNGDGTSQREKYPLQSGLGFMLAKRILLIDDERRLARVIQACLSKLGGWTVIVATSGADGLTKAETEQPDAILLDIMMPDMDGIMLLQHLKKHPVTAAIPVILLTAKLPAIAADPNNPLPISGMIAKPFEPLNLAEQIAEILAW